MTSTSGPTEDELLPFQVWASDSFHLSGEGESYRVGGFGSCAEARAACERLVDEFLQSRYVPGMTLEELLEEHRGYGAAPWVRGAEEECAFDADGYARRRCAEICRE